MWGGVSGQKLLEKHGTYVFEDVNDSCFDHKKGDMMVALESCKLNYGKKTMYLESKGDHISVMGRLMLHDERMGFNLTKTLKTKLIKNNRFRKRYF